MKLVPEIKYLIIARKEYHHLLFSLKEKEPSLDFNLVTPELFYSQANFDINVDAIPFLLQKEQYDFNTIKDIISIIKKGDIKHNQELERIYNELEENKYIIKNELFSLELKQKEVVVFEEKENKELFSFLKRKRIEYKSLSLDEIGLKENRELKPLLFENKLKQYFYIFSSIRNKIINEKIDPNDISILTTDEKDLFYLKYCSDIFSIDVDISFFTSIRTNPEINLFITESYNNRKFDYEKTRNSTLKEIFDFYHLERLKDFDFALLNLNEILATYKEKNQPSSGIKVTSNFSLDNKIIYITNFQYDVFYKVYQDNRYFNDSSLEKIGLNTSYTRSLIDKDFKMNFLHHSNIAILSRYLSSKEEKSYPSQLIEELDLTYENADNNPSGLYTSKALKIIQSIDKDLFSFKDDSEYKSYSNKYKKIPTEVLDSSSMFNSISASVLKEYFSCPYSFYLSRILTPDTKTSTNEVAILGTLLHLIFENNYQDLNTEIKDVDFDSLFDKSIKKIKEEYELDELSKKYLYLSKDYIKAYYLSSLRHKFFNPNIKHEERKDIEFSFDTTITVDDIDYNIQGRIDKVLYVSSSEKKYYTIIDYKSSTHDVFDLQLVKYGGSLQLPLYYIGIGDLVSMTDYTFGGFFIHNIFNKSGVKPDDNTPKLENYFSRLSGLYLHDIDFISAFDQGMLNASGDKITSSRNSPNSFVNSLSYFSEDVSFNAQINKYNYSFKQLIEDAKKAIASTADSIYDNDFQIAPKVKNSNSTPKCSYCQYKDICYHRNSDIVSLEDKIEEDFGYSNIFEEEEREY